MSDTVFIGNIELRGRLTLAPMAGVTDLAFRSVCVGAGAALCCTEMVSAKALVYKDAKTRALLAVSPGERPVGAQIFGSDPVLMGEAAALALEISGADFIDINMGCPVGKIAGSGDGCALMRDPPKAARIVQAVVGSVPVPVTVKMRKGWDSGSVNAVEVAGLCEAAGAAAVAVHGRTRAQQYAGVADWDIIRAVKAALKIPVLANGDVFAPEDGARILKYTGADLAMVGRGSFGNPWIFTQGNAVLRGEAVPPLPPLGERLDTALWQLRRAAEVKGEKIACLEARRHLSWYLKGVPYAGIYRRQITELSTLEQADRLIEGAKRDLR